MFSSMRFDFLGKAEQVLNVFFLQPQQFNLLPKESALSNVALPLIYAGVPKKEREERARKALEKVGLGERVTFRPNQLSGGQQQRVAIARAMVGEPKILLADEPTGALDTKAGIQIMQLFQELHKEGATIIMITHEVEVAECADKIVMLRDGKILEERPGRGYVLEEVEQSITHHST